MAYPDSSSLSATLAGNLAQPVKQAIAASVVAVFNDKSRGEKPVTRRPDGLFGPRSVAWRVHGDVTSMMVGGVTSLLLADAAPGGAGRRLGPFALPEDMSGRLRRTARFIALTTYGGREEAEEAIGRVRRIHGFVRGTLPDGTPYSADDPGLLAWVHVTEATSFLDAWIRYAEPAMPARDQDRYFAEMALVGGMLGADPLPRTRRQAIEVTHALRPALRYDARTREVARIILNQRAPNRLLEPLQNVAMGASVDLLPAWARRMHGLPAPVLSRPLVRAGTLGIARTLRWAFG
jgi:uncharacterized protein (DUF2236 family)